MDMSTMDWVEVQYLATFKLSKRLNSPADGMQKLLKLEKVGVIPRTNKIFMSLRLEADAIILKRGNQLYEYPLQLIRGPTSFVNPNYKELYSNIFSFISYPSDVLILQCLNISASYLVDHVKMRMAKRGDVIYMTPPPNFPTSTHAGEIATLNGWLDEIEMFVGRLQYSEVAQRDLEAKMHKMNKKPSNYMLGLVSIAAKLPNELEFVDILQKFKQCFNQLSRLKEHIYNPNSAEFVHFLFAPLEIIVDASKHAHSLTLASRVVTPPLTEETVQLLKNCLTSRETTFWHSLGDAWNAPRDSWTPRNVSPAEPFVPKPPPMIYHPTAPKPKTHDNSFQIAQQAFLKTVRMQGGKMAVVTQSHVTQNMDEISVVKGEYVEVLGDTKNWWKVKNWCKKTGYVPNTVVALFANPGKVPNTAVDKGIDEADGWSSPSSDEDYNNNPPPLPPPPPTTTKQIAAPIVRKPPIKSSQLDDPIQRELNLVLREKKKIQVLKTPEIFIGENSTPKDVQEWLKAKGFADRTQKQLATLNGTQLLSMRRDQLQSVCGKEEGRRLDSQILVSRNTTGFKTTKSIELRTILAKARARLDTSDLQGTTGSPHPQNQIASKAAVIKPTRDEVSELESTEESEDEYSD